MSKLVATLRHFLGIDFCAADYKSTTKPNARRLLVEQLESRNLLAVVLPAPASALAQHPADNPALPSAFDVFDPPVASVAPTSSAPQLDGLTSQANPDDSLAATGFQFSTLTGASAGQDTVFQVYGQTSATNAALKDATIQELNGDKAAFTLDAGLPQKSMYLVWAENAAGASLPFAVNKTTAWWVGPDAASDGDVVSVYGENLSSGGSTPQSWIYLQPAQGKGQWITPTAVNPYKVDFVVPAGLAAGSYQVWVHNGHGGQYGWSSPVTLTVQSPYNYGHLVVNLSDFGALPNTGTDASAALQAAINAIGNTSPATIQLQAGTYYVSQDVYIGAGFGFGVDLQGAGKNLTFIKPLPGFSGEWLMNFGPTSKVSDLTLDATGAQLQYSAIPPCASVVNVSIIAPFSNDITGTLDGVLLKNDDFTGRGVFLVGSNQLIVTGCNFYATNQTNVLLYVWSGSGISVTDCTAQDFSVNSPDPQDHGQGRFFGGQAIYGNQSDVYIGDNTTINFSQMPTYGNQGAGEQIMWEGNEGKWSSLATSATGDTVTLSALNAITLNGGPNVQYEAVVTAGKGTGQYRTIAANDTATGGTTLTLDSAWDVIPDATSRINIITTEKRIVIYHNTLQGNSNFGTGSASTGIAPEEGGVDIIADQNAISNLRFGVNDWAYTDHAWTTLGVSQPEYFTLYLNNIITNCEDGIRSFNEASSLTGVGAPNGETATDIGNVYRNNTMTGIHITGWIASGGNGTTMDIDVFEHNHIADAPISIQAPALPGPVYKNVLDRGAADAAGSQPIQTQGGTLTLATKDTCLNFPFLQNPAGTNTSAISTQSWSGAAVVVANGQPGYWESGTWGTESSVGDYGGTDRYATASGNGNNTATWQLSGLAPGQYVVQVTWPGYHGNTSRAPFAIYDGAVLVQTVVVDEKRQPQGAVYGTAAFQQIATVNISSGTLSVVLSNSGTNDGWIIANAVRIAPATNVSGPVIVANGQPGYLETGTWGTESYAGDYGGTDRYATAAGNGNNTATWQVNGLAAGSYSVQVSWSAYFGNASNAPFAIYDGTTLLQTVLVDETQPPLGAVYGTAAFQQIATVNISSDMLSVVLSNSGTNDGWIIANAVRIAPATNVSGPVIVANGQPGYLETGTWGTESYAGDYGGTDRYATAAGNGNNTATWQVNGLAAGSYSVQVSWSAYFGNASNAPFAIYDGTTLLQTVLVDETQPPLGAVYGTAAFQQIATVNISSGTLSVVLSNSGTNDGWIIANAVRIAPATSVSGPVIVANGQPGYLETGAWGTESYAGDYGGTDRYATAAGNGNNAATWQVNGLAAGSYSVQVSWSAYFGNASNASFAIYDGTTLLQTVLVDETQLPLGAVYGGVPFQQIATVNIISGTLKVILSASDANNAWLIANAIRVAPM